MEYARLIVSFSRGLRYRIQSSSRDRFHLTRGIPDEQCAVCVGHTSSAYRDLTDVGGQTPAFRQTGLVQQPVEIFYRRSVLETDPKTNPGLVAEREHPCEETGGHVATEPQPHAFLIVHTVLHIGLGTADVRTGGVVAQRCGHQGTLAVRTYEEIGGYAAGVGVDGHAGFRHLVVLVTDTVLHRDAGGLSRIGQLDIEIGTVYDVGVRAASAGEDTGGIGKNDLRCGDDPFHLGLDAHVLDDLAGDHPRTVHRGA